MPQSRVDDSVVYIDGPWTHRTVSANGSVFHVAECDGNGPLILLLHGFGDFWWTWRKQLTDLASAGFRAIAVDLRGYGGSDKPPRGYDGYTLAADAAGLIRALGAEDAYLIGHDWGGFIGWSTAVLHPKSVRGLITLGAPHPLRLREALTTDRRQITASANLFAFQLPRYEHVVTKNDAAYIRHVFTRWAGPRWRGTPEFDAHVAVCQQAMQIQQVAFCAMEYYRWAMRSLTRRSGWRFAKMMSTLITAPVLQIHGALDSCILPNTARGARKYAGRGLHYRELQDIGHFPQVEDPITVNDEIRSWLNLQEQRTT
ncbi:MAG: alpha/beta hydrolase [Corynebacteriales bacterium]|nr:alpha/beta hydrolase [Mycobacteriales bacterium]